MLKMRKVNLARSAGAVMLGMAIALAAAIAGVTGNYALLVGMLVVGGAVGFVLARRVQMTQMPELVAILHSLVGLAAALVGYATFLDPDGQHYQGAEKTIHDIEIYLGILIGAVTFSGGRRGLKPEISVFQHGPSPYSGIQNRDKMSSEWCLSRNLAEENPGAVAAIDLDPRHQREIVVPFEIQLGRIGDFQIGAGTIQ